MSWNVWNVAEARWEHTQSFKTRAEALHMCGRGCEVRKAGDVLEEHGTKLMQLKPSMIWRCAMDDLQRFVHNKTVTAEGTGEYKQYAFHRRHVAVAFADKATVGTANDILRAAIAEPGLGLASGKKDTRLLYSDVELLKAALS